MDLQTILNTINTVFGGLDMIIAGLILIFTLIPGDQPEAALRKAAELIAKFSRKKAV